MDAKPGKSFQNNLHASQGVAHSSLPNTFLRVRTRALNCSMIPAQLQPRGVEGVKGAPHFLARAAHTGCARRCPRPTYTLRRRLTSDRRVHLEAGSPGPPTLATCMCHSCSHQENHRELGVLVEAATPPRAATDISRACGLPASLPGPARGQIDRAWAAQLGRRVACFET